MDNAASLLTTWVLMPLMKQMEPAAIEAAAEQIRARLDSAPLDPNEVEFLLTMVHALHTYAVDTRAESDA